MTFGFNLIQQLKFYIVKFKLELHKFFFFLKKLIKILV